MPSAEVLAAAQQKVNERERCKRDKLYLSHVLGYDFQEDVHVDLFANYLQLQKDITLFEQSDIKDRMVLWARGHFKTSSIVVEVIQLILNFPDIRILLMQGTVKNTKLLLKEIKSHFIGEAHNSQLHELFPEFCADKLGTTESFTVPARVRKHLKEGTVTVASPKTVKAGQHYDAGFFDDLVNEQNYLNPELVKKAIDDFNHYTPLIDPGGYKYVTGTRYVFGDLYEWIIEKNKETKSWAITHRACWDILPDGTKRVVFPQRKLSDGRLIGFTLEMLEKFQREDPEMFSCQYLNQPAMADRQQFTEELLMKQVRDEKDKYYPAANPVVLFIDLAASKKSYSDHSVILAGRANAYGAWVCDCVGGRFHTPELADQVLLMAAKHRPYKILIEGTAAGKIFLEYLKVIAPQRGMYLPLEEIKVDNRAGAKEIRISALAGEMASNRLFFLVGLPTWERIFKEFTQYSPGKKHDDYPDTVALMVQYFQQNIPQAKMPSILDHPMFQPNASKEALLQNGIDPAEPSTPNDLGSFFCA